MDLQNIKGGALMTRANLDLDKIIENIMDLNTNPTKPRALTLTLKFSSNEDRTEIFCDMQSKASLQPIRSVSTVFQPVERGEKTELVELRRGEIPGQSMVDLDTGEIIEGKVVGMRR